MSNTSEHPIPQLSEPSAAAPLRTRYLVVTGGELPATWGGWLDDGRHGGEVATMVTCDGCTAIDVRVIDQAALLALLQRLHALHLPLLHLARLPA
jgi:hypothetical protein